MKCFSMTIFGAEPSYKVATSQHLHYAGDIPKIVSFHR